MVTTNVGRTAQPVIDSSADATDMPSTCAGARAIITALLQRCSKDTRQVEQDAHLAASELVSNALKHAGGLTGFRADLSPDATRLRLQVEDADPRPPRSRKDADLVQPGGRGWTIVKRLAATCSVALLPNAGKRITVTLAV
ncbi:MULTISPECIES: ATP-binding protein [unclassified Streptomyces]|uniref:ATP-binding protein n=1 Tax=Streptomyces sp. NPDC059980 TaxID=3347022 RepID=UPI0036BFCA88